jgi:uncharacterized protein
MRFLYWIFTYLVLFLLLRAVLRLFMGGYRSGRRPSESKAAARELKKDPVCGTYVPAGGGITRDVNGQLFHFCSEACRDKYAAK